MNTLPIHHPKERRLKTFNSKAQLGKLILQPALHSETCTGARAAIDFQRRRRLPPAQNLLKTWIFPSCSLFFTGFHAIVPCFVRGFSMSSCPFRTRNAFRFMSPGHPPRSKRCVRAVQHPMGLRAPVRSPGGPDGLAPPV